MNLRKIRLIFLVLSLMVIAGTVGYEIGTREVEIKWQNYQPKVAVVKKEPNIEKEIDFSLFWEVWNRLEKYYVDKSKIDPQKMVWGAISGMTQSLGDPYTVFLPPKENKEAKEDLAGKFEGIGAQLGMKDKKIVVVAPLSGTPAEKAGIKAGDWIVKVNGKETVGWTLPQAVAEIRGPKGTKVTLNILQEKAEKPVDIEIVRDTITIKSIESWSKKVADIVVISDFKEVPEIAGKQIAYLKLSRFGDGTNGEWNKTVREISSQWQKKEIKGLILDLRNNPGGYLNSAVYIASEFLADGLIVSQESTGGIKQNYNVNRQGQLTDVPLVVLINKGSASASEIVAGALSDRKRAKLVGESSFGKGSVQEAQELPGGAGLHVTTAKWVLPSGNWINNTGLTPDFKIETEEKEATFDGQLKKAIEILLRK